MVLREVGGGRFAIQGLAGEGGMSLVYRARDDQTGMPVAVKVLRDGMSVADRFVRESRLLAALDDPGVVGYVEHGVTETGQHFLVTEWLEGHSLAERLEASTLTLEDVLRLGRRVAETLGRLHARGIVHRDIKPSNLFLRGGAIDRVTLIDFGIARYSDVAGDVTRTGTAVGTPGYMAPEQARGERDIDARADVFALGCVLFRCLTGRTPFRGDDALAVQLKIMLEETPSMREHRPDIPDVLDDLVRRMLARAREERPAHGAAIARELARVPAASLQFAPGPREVEGLTAAERHLVSIVLVRSGGDAITLLSAEAGPRAAAMSEIASAHGAQLAWLGEGDAVLTVAGDSAATDQVMRAARCALSLAHERPGAVIAIATGTGILTQGLPSGQVFDRATDLARVAGPGILIDDVTAGLLPPLFDTDRDGGGVRLLRERESSEPIRTLLGRPTSFVGRRKEMRILDAIFDECASERVARGVLLIGPAGIGKSRVRYEFMRAAEGRDDRPQVWLGRGDPLLASSPFGVLAQMLRRQSGVWQGHSLDARRSALRARVSRSVDRGQVDLVTAFLGEMIGLPFADKDNPPLRAARESARLMNDRISESWSALVAAESVARPLVLIIEDAHWADLSSLRLVEETLGLAQPCLVIAIARPDVDDVHPRLWAGRDVQRVVISPLTRAASAALVRDALGAGVADEAVARICERSAGNAFFLEELIRAEAERSGETAPGTVLAVVQARLESLDLELRRVLRAASLFGQAFWRGAVDALLGPDESLDVDRCLEALMTGEVITRASETRIQGQTQFAFRHALVREAAYDTLTDDDRMRGHRLAADWLERAGEADAAVVAEHHEKGGALDRAAPWWKVAGERAMAGADPDQAIAFAGKAIACGADGELLGEVELIRAAAFDWQGQFELGLVAANVAVDRLPKPGRLWCRAATLQARLLVHGGDTDALRALASAVLELVRRGPITLELANAAVVVSYMCRMIVSRGDDEGLLETIETLSPPGILADPTIRGFLALCRTVLVQANIAEDLAARREAAAHFAEAGDTVRSRMELYNSYFDLMQLGAYDEARRGLDSVFDWATRHKISSLAWSADCLRGEALFLMGEARQSIPILMGVLENYRRGKSPRQEGSVSMTLARVHLELGDIDAARAAATRAVDVLALHGRPLYPVALAILALVELVGQRPLEALALAHRAVDEMSGAEALEAGETLVHLSFIESLRATGDDAGFRVAVARARARLDELAGQISEPELRRNFLAVTENARILALSDQLG